MARNYTELDLGMCFGIELECIAVYKYGLFDQYFNDMENEPGARDVIAALSHGCDRRGIFSTGHEGLDDDLVVPGIGEFGQWVFKDEGGLELSPKELEQLGLDPGEEYEILPLEVASRKMDFMHDNWQVEIKTVLSVFDEIRKMGCRFITNSTTGFHIHMSLGEQRYPLRTAKSVLQLCTGFEDRLDALYSINRIDENAAKNSDGHFNAGVAWMFQHNELTDFGPNVFHWLRSIEDVTSFAEIGKFFQNWYTNPRSQRTYKTNAHYSTLNLDNLYDPEPTERPTGTIEFRQHGGTLDFEKIVAHVLLKKTLVSFCHAADDRDFLLLFAHVSNPAFRLSDLLRTIGASRELLEYHEQRCSHATQSAKAFEFERTVEAMNNGEFEGLVALEAAAYIEDYQRSNWQAVSAKIHQKHIVGAYADLRTKPFDIETEYNNFIWGNFGEGNTSWEQIETAARSMVFLQLDGGDAEFDVEVDEQSGKIAMEAEDFALSDDEM